MNTTVLDVEEKAIIDSYDRGEWRPVKNPEEELSRLRECARSTLTKNRRINIRMSSKDLDQLQVLAVQEGVPYQTLISSIMHKYVSGRLVERRKA